jgi:hypothetical protein
MKILMTMFLLTAFAAVSYGETISGLCMVSASPSEEAAEVIFRSSDCGDGGVHCNNSNESNIAWSRWTNLSAGQLRQEGASLNGHINGEAGDLQCSGTVHDGILAGRYDFSPNQPFLQKMGSMGFSEITPHKQMSFLLLDVTATWTQQMKDTGVTGLTTNKLMGLRALHVDPNYIHAMSAAGYPELQANKLTEMKAVGVTPEKARDARALGFQPSEQELIQMSIFKVDRPFIERMRARGLTDLTLAKLIKVKIFKLDE